MPQFGRSSKSRLETCHPDLQRVFNRVVETYDCSILEGAREKSRQQMLFGTGKSTTLNSKHIPFEGWSYAVDAVPYPIAWGENEQKALLTAMKNRDAQNIKKLMNEYKMVFARFYNFAGFVQGVAAEMGVKIRWGGDWDSDRDFNDQKFHDLPHFELIR